MNEDELAMIAPDPMSLAATAIAAGVSCLFVTLGKRGAIYVAAPGFDTICDLPPRAGLSTAPRGGTGGLGRGAHGARSGGACGRRGRSDRMWRCLGRDLFLPDARR